MRLRVRRIPSQRSASKRKIGATPMGNGLIGVGGSSSDDYLIYCVTLSFSLRVSCYHLVAASNKSTGTGQKKIL